MQRALLHSLGIAGLALAGIARFTAFALWAVAVAIALYAFVAFTTRFTAAATVIAAFAVVAFTIGIAFFIALARAAVAATAIALAVAAIARTTLTVAAIALAFGLNGSYCRLCSRLGAKAKQALEPGEEALFLDFGTWRSSWRWCLCAGATLDGALCRLWAGFWRRRGIRQHTLDDWGLLVGGLLRAARDLGHIFHFVRQLVAGIHVFQAWVVVL